MLKKFEVKNYKNFKEKISIDFGKVGGYQFNKECISNGLIAKMLIYGRNATGKTNLGNAIMDIRSVLFSSAIWSMNSFLNADSLEKNAEFTYCFQFGHDEAIYSYSKENANTITCEKLEVNGAEIFNVRINNSGMVLSPSVFLDNLELNISRYSEVYNTNDERGNRHTISFLRWLVNNSTLPEDNIIMKLYNYVRTMYGVSMPRSPQGLIYREGTAVFQDLENKSALKDLEKFLNIMGVSCELVLRKLPDGTSELYFKHEKLIPFAQTASSGTIALFNIYRRISNMNDVSFVYIDEFDAFYHYEMSERFIAFIKEHYANAQVILTTHNTNLMTNRIMRPDCLMILSSNGRLTPLCDATARELREGHNLEKLYISGEFSAYE